MRDWLRRVQWVVTAQFGLHPQRLVRGMLAWPAYLRDRRRFARLSGGPLAWRPCLHDRVESSGDARSEYFLQDLEVARRLFATAPRRVLDVGSRLDGFVAHVASFRTIDVLDVRPQVATVSGVRFHQADITNPAQVAAIRTVEGLREGADAVTCLHVLEHIGLGRYGDPLDPEGPARALDGLSQLLAPGGRLYLSTPIGRPRIEFNANRVFDPAAIPALARTVGLHVTRMSVLLPDRGFEDAALDEAGLARWRAAAYHLAIFECVREGAV